MKLTRTVLLIPLSILVGLLFGDDTAKISLLDRAKTTMPWFVLGFLALAVANTTHLLGGATASFIAEAGSLLLIVVLAAVGLGVDVQAIWRMGLKPLLIGFALATTMALISYGLLWTLQVG